MNFNDHSKLEGRHAFLGASKYHWINYDIKKLEEVYLKSIAVQKGTELHEFAAKAIRLGIKLPKTQRTLNMYVNDAIGYKMVPEQILYFSDNCFGTADSICFRNNYLRIHDLKTGDIPGSIHQLEIYMALFCLEYKCDPLAIKSELRIYQNDEVFVYEPKGEDIVCIINKIITFDERIEKIKTGA